MCSTFWRRHRAPVAPRRRTSQTDPLQCWWRTSAGAVRVGEPFTVVLTCAVLETDAATVVVDQSRLEPSVVQFAPFEVLGGSHGADLRTDQRRFFQYVYRLRLIAENLFGKDVSLPETKLSYHVQTQRRRRSAALQGRDQTYLLPPQSVRVMSLVPADATDIRDTPGETFSDLDQRGVPRQPLHHHRRRPVRARGADGARSRSSASPGATARPRRPADRLMTDGSDAARRRPRARGGAARARARRLDARPGGTRARRAADRRHLHARAAASASCRANKLVGRRRTRRPGGRHG